MGKVESNKLPAGFGQIPQSRALAEADPESLTELFSRDPEGYSQIDLEKIIFELRASRARFVTMEQNAKTGLPKAKKAKNLGQNEVTLAPGEEDLF